MEWIKCSKKLPPIGSEVLIAFGHDSSHVNMAYRLVDEWRYSNGNIISSSVKYWMPLPEPPKD